MVNAPDTSSTLKTLFTGRPEMLIQYMLSQGRLAVILLDQQGTIVDCNPFFLESMAINEKPVGQSIDAFLREGFPVFRDLTPGDCLPVKLTFAWNDAIEHSLAGHILKEDGHYVIFAHSVRLTDHKLAAALFKTYRKEDIVARYGGDEFVVILPNSPAASAVECAERIRKTIEETVCPEIDRRITVSMGATLFMAGDTEESLIKRADAALYNAKASRRNRVFLKEKPE